MGKAAILIKKNRQMKNLEECVNELTELGRLELDFEIQIIRSNRCLELCDADGSDRWNNEAQKTLDKIKEYHYGKV